MNKNPRSN